MTSGAGEERLCRAAAACDRRSPAWVQALSDRSGVVFDDERVVVNAGIVLAVALGRRLGIEALVDAAVRLGGRPRLRPGGKVAV